MRRKAVAWTLVAIWAIAIFVASAHSGEQIDDPTSLFGMAKAWLAGVLSRILGQPVEPSPVGHFLEYLVFGGLLTWAFWNHVRDARAPLLALGASALYAVSDEFHQMFVPGRACDPADWLVDVSATAIAALICWAVLKRMDSSSR